MSAYDVSAPSPPATNEGCWSDGSATVSTFHGLQHLRCPLWHLCTHLAELSHSPQAVHTRLYEWWIGHVKCMEWPGALESIRTTSARKGEARPVDSVPACAGPGSLSKTKLCRKPMGFCPPKSISIYICVHIYIYTVYYVCIRRLIEFPFNQFLAKMITSEAMLIP